MTPRTVLVTGSGGLIGSEAARWCVSQGYRVEGVDNDMRQHFFGRGASTAATVELLRQELGSSYSHNPIDIRDRPALASLVAGLGRNLSAIIHTAAQPSHDWAATDPHMDFEINAGGTLNLLELARTHCPESPFVFTSTNKVYGDSPNTFELIEYPTRFDLPEHHRFYEGVDESQSIDQSMHSVFGASKVAADVMVQEYGRYFGLPTVCFRGGCLTGASHAGAEQHGFLSYLMRCAMTGRPYSVYGYSGKQVRDNIHGRDLIAMFAAFIASPKSGAVYNAGGSRFSNCSVIEAIRICESIVGRPMQVTHVDQARAGDHKWWVSDVRKFSNDYPSWKFTWSLQDILESIYRDNAARWCE